MVVRRDSRVWGSDPNWVEVRACIWPPDKPCSAVVDRFDSCVVVSALIWALDRLPMSDDCRPGTWVPAMLLSWVSDSEPIWSALSWVIWVEVRAVNCVVVRALSWFCDRPDKAVAVR